jgi:hypothetical protein
VSGLGRVRQDEFTMAADEIFEAQLLRSWRVCSVSSCSGRLRLPVTNAEINTRRTINNAPIDSGHYFSLKARPIAGRCPEEIGAPASNHAITGATA